MGELVHVALAVIITAAHATMQSASAHELDLPNTLLLTRNLLVAAWCVQGLVSLCGSSQH